MVAAIIMGITIMVRKVEVVVVTSITNTQMESIQASQPSQESMMELKIT
jgi:hypothetical protein